MRERIPGYAEAIAREKFLRNCAFLPLNEDICGLEVLPLNLRHVQFLSIVDSPFAYSAPPKEKLLQAHPAVLRGWIQQFFWIVSPHYRAGWSWRKIALRLRVARLDDAAAVDGICEYVREAFWDADGSGQIVRAYYSWLAAMIGSLSPKYGDDETLMTKPLKRLFQYQRREAHRRGETLENRSDEIRRNYRAAKNAERQTHADAGRN